MVRIMRSVMKMVLKGGASYVLCSSQCSVLLFLYMYMHMIYDI